MSKCINGGGNFRKRVAVKIWSTWRQRPLNCKKLWQFWQKRRLEEFTCSSHSSLASQFWFSEALGFEYKIYCTKLRTQKPGQHDPAASKRESTVSPLQEDWTDVLHVLHPLCFGAEISLNLGPFSANVHSVNLVWISCELRFEKTVPEVKADHREWQQEVIDLPLPGRRTNATPMRIFARCYHILSSNIYHDESWGLVCIHWHTHYLARWLWWRESISSIHPKASWCCALRNHHGTLGSS